MENEQAAPTKRQLLLGGFVVLFVIGVAILVLAHAGFGHSKKRFCLVSYHGAADATLAADSPYSDDCPSNSISAAS